MNSLLTFYSSSNSSPFVPFHLRGSLLCPPLYTEYDVYWKDREVVVHNETLYLCQFSSFFDSVVGLCDKSLLIEQMSRKRLYFTTS